MPVNLIQYQRRSRTAATSKMERFVIIVNDFQLLSIITKCSISDMAEVLDPPLNIVEQQEYLAARDVFMC